MTPLHKTDIWARFQIVGTLVHRVMFSNDSHTRERGREKREGERKERERENERGVEREREGKTEERESGVERRGKEGERDD